VEINTHTSLKEAGQITQENATEVIGIENIQYQNRQHM
jgi:hypothetical protein